MTTESRAYVAFAALGVVLVGLAVVLSRPGVLGPREIETPVFFLPPPTPASSGYLASTSGEPPSSAPRLFQHPSLSKSAIAFAYAGEIWVVSRDGGDARRLVTGQLRNSRPIFSPDGAWIAFTGAYDNNADVYVVPFSGGEPRRLTYHPGPDSPVAWSPDGTKVLFWSLRATPRDLPKLFAVPLTGGPPEELPLPSGFEASYSPDAKQIAYVPYPQWQPAWKRYRGGQTTPIWIANLADSSFTKVPRTDSNDKSPMWVGDTIYFLSDRSGTFNLFAYDVKGGVVREVAKDPDGFDIRSASAGPGAIVYERLGKVRLFDIASGQSHDVPITVSADLPQVRARFERIGGHQILHAAVSPSGKRVLFEARGEILSAPAEKGDVRNLTRSPGVADRDPAFSPDGKWVAWLSDETGEYALYVRSPDGLGDARKIDLGAPPSFFYSPRWSPDSKFLTLTDKRLNLWLVDVGKGTTTKVDADRYDTPLTNLDPTFSPDSQWIAYAKQLPNHLHAVFVYSLDDKSTHQITDGRSDATSPRFDRGGKYLWFLASTDVGLSAGWLDMSSMGRSVASNVYAVVLRKDGKSPTAPESDEEGSASAGDKGDKGDKDKDGAKGPAKKDGADKAKKDDKKASPVRIDFDGIDQRIVALPIDRANYAALEAGPEGVIFVLRAPLSFADEDYLEFDDDEPPPFEVLRFELKTRKTEPFVERIDGGGATYGGLVTFMVSADGTKALYAHGKEWFLIPTEKGSKPAEGALKIDGVDVWVDPRAEWHQMFREVWRLERDFLYDPGAHGLDLAAAEKVYAPFVDAIAGRDDLNTLFEEMLGNLVLGHVFVYGGAMPPQRPVGVGLLGADYTIEKGRYRIAKILSGENWNPKLRAPLTQPGVEVKEGDFILAVNGQQLRGDDDISRLFLGTAGKQTVLTVGPTPDGSRVHNVTVVPVGSEGALRLRTWMEASRKKVDELSKGRVGYVFIPDTAAGGFANFNRYYFSQVGKDAVVLDERFNHGGQIADYIVDLLKRTPQMANTTREGEDVVEPAQAIFGPKVMIANQMSGSGGDALPWLFKKAAIGPLVGVRTWGGLVGIGGYPKLVDGCTVTAPRWGLYGTGGEWEVENHGIAPDIEVEQDPALMRQGHDPQLERAVQAALDALAKTPPTKLVRPPFPNYGPRLPHT